MKISLLLSGNKKIFTLILVVAGIFFLAATPWSSSSQLKGERDQLPAIMNRTESFQLVSVERVGRLLQLKLRNTSERAITAYRVSSGNGWETGIDYILGDESVAPGEVEEFRTPLSNLANPDGSKLSYQVVTISAVVFDNQSIEGDFDSANFILNERRGQKVQLERINREIQASFKEVGADQYFALSKLKSRIAALPENRQKGEPLAFQFGLQYMKEHVLKQIEELDRWSKSGGSIKIQGEFHGSKTLRDGLTKLLDLNNERVAKL